MNTPNTPQFIDIGDVQVERGQTIASGESFLKGLPSCRVLRIHATSATTAQWLAEVHLLVGS